MDSVLCYRGLQLKERRRAEHRLRQLRSQVLYKTVVMNISSSVDAVTLAKQVRAQLSDYEDVSMAGGK